MGLSTAHALGIAQPNLLWVNQEKDRNQLLNSIAKIGARSIRTEMREVRDLSRLSKAIEGANGLGIGAVIAIMVTDSDIAPAKRVHAVGSADYPTFKKYCGWDSGIAKLSDLKPSQFRARLETHLQAFKAKGLRIDAFEVGNELNWACFNGDIPWNAYPNRSAIKKTAIAYGSMALVSRWLIKKYYPQAKILTFGWANVDVFAKDPKDGSPHSQISVRDFYQALQWAYGRWFLDSVFDGIGIHVYPSSVLEMDSQVRLFFDRMRKQWNLSNRTPFWVTEWGFSKTLSIRQNADRTQVLAKLRNAIEREKPLEHYFFALFAGTHSVAEKSDQGLISLLPEALSLAPHSH